MAHEAAAGASQSAYARVSWGTIDALKEARARHGVPHRRAFVEPVLELTRRRRAGHNIMGRRLEADEPTRGPRTRLHVRGLMPHRQRCSPKRHGQRSRRMVLSPVRVGRGSFFFRWVRPP